MNRLIHDRDLTPPPRKRKTTGAPSSGVALGSSPGELALMTHFGSLGISSSRPPFMSMGATTGPSFPSVGVSPLLSFEQASGGENPFFRAASSSSGQPGLMAGQGGLPPVPEVRGNFDPYSVIRNPALAIHKMGQFVVFEDINALEHLSLQEISDCALYDFGRSATMLSYLSRRSAICESELKAERIARSSETASLRARIKTEKDHREKAEERRDKAEASKIVVTRELEEARARYTTLHDEMTSRVNAAASSAIEKYKSSVDFQYYGAQNYLKGFEAFRAHAEEAYPGQFTYLSAFSDIEHGEMVEAEDDEEGEYEKEEGLKKRSKLLLMFCFNIQNL